MDLNHDASSQGQQQDQPPQDAAPNLSAASPNTQANVNTNANGSGAPSPPEGPPTTAAAASPPLSLATTSPSPAIQNAAAMTELLSRFKSTSSSTIAVQDYTLSFKSIMTVKLARSGTATSKAAMERSILAVIKRALNAVQGAVGVSQDAAAEAAKRLEIPQEFFDDHVEADDSLGFHHVECPIGAGYSASYVFRRGAEPGTYEYAIKVGLVRFEVAPRMVIVTTEKDSFFRSSRRDYIEYLPVTLTAADFRAISDEFLTGSEGAVALLAATRGD